MVALDLETKVLSKKDLLTNERILGISLARRHIYEKIPKEIESQILILEEETDESEFKHMSDVYWKIRKGDMGELFKDQT